MMRMSNSLKNMGILQISNLRNTNGSYTCKVAVKKIMVQSEEGNYRKFSDSHASEILEDFSLRSTRNPILFVHQQTLKTVDGRHTTMIWRKKGTKNITCDIHFKITPSEAAKIFYDLATNTKRMGTWDAYKAALSASLPEAVAVKKYLTKYKLTIPIELNSRTADIRTYTPLGEAYENGKEFLDKTLYVLSETYRSSGLGLHQPAGGCAFMRGLISFLRDKSDVGCDEIVSRLKGFTGYRVADLAGQIANTEGYNRADRPHYKQAFNQIFTKTERLVA